MAPSQAASSQIKRFFTTQPLSTLIPTLSVALTTVIPRPRGPPEITLTPNPSSTLTSVVALITSRFVDNRKQNISAIVKISIGHIPRAVHEEGGLGQCGEEGVGGLDVVVWKQYGDPMELTRVWRELLRVLPNGIVYTM
ncbi:hypothetical protein P7C70_g1867, partial [Phenoliferia sp. Uapishka_3]